MEKKAETKGMGTILQAAEDLRNGKIILCIDDPDRENPLVGVDDFTEAVKAYVEQRSRDYRRDNAPLWEQVRDLPEQQEALGCQEIISGYFDGAEDGLWRYVLYTEDSLAGETAGHQTLVLRFQPETGEVLIEEAA